MSNSKGLLNLLVSKKNNLVNLQHYAVRGKFGEKRSNGCHMKGVDDMSDKMVSIIMGVYNCEPFVSNCIDSVINQTYKNWEFIICDDCSTDNTWEILKRYQAMDSRIKLIKNERNSKLAASLNQCLEICHGEYVARMDADDICLQNRLQVQVDFLNNHREYAVVATAANVFDGEQITSVRRMKEIPSKEDVIFGPTFMHPTIMMRKEVYDELDGYTVAQRTERGQDWDLWFRFFAKGYKGYNLQEPYIQYHESKKDLKKRTMKTAKMYFRTALFGYRLIRVPFYKYIYAIKPIVAVLIPQILINKTMRNYRWRFYGKFSNLS